MSDEMMEGKNLPQGWSLTTLGQILPLSYGKSLPARSRGNEGEFIVFGSSGEVGNHTEGLTDGVTIIVGRKGSAGSVHFSPKGCWPIDTAYYVEPSEQLIPKYWYYLLLSYRLGELDQSTAIPSLNRDIYGQQLTLLPPKNEQHRIVSKIDELFSDLDEAEANLHRVGKLVRQYRQAVLKAAVTGELTRQWREQNRDRLESGEALLARILAARRAAWEKTELQKMAAKGIKPKNDDWKKKYQGPQPPDTTDLPDLPAWWVWATIDQLAAPIERAIQSGPFGSNLKHSEFQPEGKLVIGIDNVREGFFSLGSQNRISDAKFQELKKYQARPRDVFITVMATIGRTCVVPADIEPAIITKHVYRISTDHSLVVPEFLNLCLWGGPVVRRQLFDNVQGQTRPGLNKSILVKIAVPLPNIEEQKVILKMVDEALIDVDRQQKLVRDELNRSSLLRQSILRAAFAGKLVPQDPNDEPASELLKRIAAEKAAVVAARRMHPGRGRKKNKNGKGRTQT
ncbi:MAG: restriction endonuclease subunit S [Desulfobulbaceae bacterium]